MPNVLMRNLSLAFLTCSLWSTAQAAEDATQKQAELSQVNNHIQTLQKTLARGQAEQIDMQQQLKISEIQIGSYSREMTTLNVQLDAATSELTKVTRMQQIALHELITQQKTLAQQLRVIYQLRQTQSLKSVLDPDNLNVTHRHLAYYRYLNNARIKLCSRIKEILADLTKNVTTIANQEQNLKQLLQRKQQQQTQLQQAQARRERILTVLNEKIFNHQQQLNQLLNNQKSLQAMVNTFQTETISVPALSFKQYQGRLSWPTKGMVLSTTGANTPHEQRLAGVVIKAPEGAAVHSIYPGKVIFANWLRGFGLLVIINHGDGYMSLYGRNHALYTKVGDTVKAGDIIATIGNSGGFTAPSLYFEIRRNGLPIDPRNWCT
jgi:septal ring factor EnvC (AmiA/AmiB activator)